MSAFLTSNPYAIGYLDSGYGHSASLTEIHLKNKAGFYLNSKEADISATADVALAASIIPTTSDGKPDPEADWSGVHMYDLAGNSSWPIINFSYFYVDKDVGVLGNTGTLLKAFLEFVLSASGQAMLETFGFTKLPLDIETYVPFLLSRPKISPKNLSFALRDSKDQKIVERRDQMTGK